MADQHVSARTRLGSLQQNTLLLPEMHKCGRRTCQRSSHACRLIMRHLQRHHKWCYSRALMHWRLNTGQSLTSSIACAHHACNSPLQTNTIERHTVGAALEEAAPRDSADIVVETKLQRENERLRAELAAANRLKQAVLQRCGTLRKQLGDARLAASTSCSIPPMEAGEICASASHLSDETPRKRRRPASPVCGASLAPTSPDSLSSLKSLATLSPAPTIVAPVATPIQPALPPRAPPLSAPSQICQRSVREGTTTAILMTPPRGHKPFVFTCGKQVQQDKRNEEVNAAEHAEGTKKEEEQAEEEGGDEDDTKRLQRSKHSVTQKKFRGDNAEVSMANIIATLQGLMGTAAGQHKQQRQASPAVPTEPEMNLKSKASSHAWCAIKPDTGGDELANDSEEVLLPETRHAVRCQLERWRRKYSQQDSRDAKADIEHSQRTQEGRQPANLNQNGDVGQRQNTDQDRTKHKFGDKHATRDNSVSSSEQTLKQASKQKVQQSCGEMQQSEHALERSSHEIKCSPQVELKKVQLRQLQEKLKAVTSRPARMKALSARVGELVKLRMTERLQEQSQEHDEHPSSESMANESDFGAESLERMQSNDFVTPRSSPSASPRRRYHSPLPAPQAHKSSPAAQHTRLAGSGEELLRCTASTRSPLVGRACLSCSQKPPLSGGFSHSPGTANAAHALHMPSVAPRIATRAGRAAYDRSPLRNRLPRDATPVAMGQERACPIFGSRLGDAFVAGAHATPESPGVRAAAGAGAGSSQFIPRRRLAAINAFDGNTRSIHKKSPGLASRKVDSMSSPKDCSRNTCKNKPDGALTHDVAHADHGACQLGSLRKAGKAAVALMADVAETNSETQHDTFA